MNQSFQEAVAQFRQFVAANGYPQDVVWVTPDDVILSGGAQVYVRVPTLRGNEKSARQRFETGMSRKVGVLFAILCEVEGATCSYVWVPKDESEAQEGLMPTGIKMSARTGSSRIHGEPIRNLLRWSYLHLKYRKNEKLKEQLFQ